MRTGILERLERSRPAKALMAAAIFFLIVGGWAGFRHYRDSSAALPNPAQQPDACALWFIGSSSIHRWTSLAQDMVPWKTYNRGIDDAGYVDILPRFANSGEEAKPAAIILYAGENDIARDIPVRTVLHDLAAFLDLRGRTMEDVPVIMLSMKPSPGRWSHFRQQRLFNAAARQLLPHVRQAYYADITAPLLIDGRLGNHYRADGIHMNEAGYRIWARVVRQRLREVLPGDVLKRCDPK